MLTISRTLLVVVPILAASSTTAEEPAAKQGSGAEASETSALKIAKVLADDASPAVRWVETERLRACCYGFHVGSMPKLDLGPPTRDVKQRPPHKITLQGENIIRVHVSQGEKLKFRITARAAASPFTDSTYSIFDPAGKHVADGIVKLGESQDVAIPTENEGLYLVYLNSGPASDNTLDLEVLNRFWIIDGRGKGAYVSTPVITNSFRDLSLAGFNTVFLGSWSWGVDFSTDEGLNAWVRKIEPWAKAAKRYNMRLIPYVGWGCAKNETEAAGEYRKNISTRQIDGPRPCPLSQEYWDRTFLRRAMAVARLSKKYPSVIGVGLDPESYYFGNWYSAESKKRKIKEPRWSSVIFFHNDECFCDHCFFGFLKSQGLQRPDVAADGQVRLKWLADQGLKEKYYKRLEDELCTLTSRLREKVHVVNPDFVFAVMLLGTYDTYWCRGVSRGLGTPRLPVFDYDEMTYTRGFTPAVDRHNKQYVKWDAHVVHGGTLWAGKHPPQDPNLLSAQMYHFAVRDSGYWVWPGNSSFWRNPDRLRHYYVLAGYQEDYWKAFVRANREIDRKLKQGDGYVCDLDTLKPPPPCRNLDKVRGSNVWSEKPFYPVRTESGTGLSFHVPKGTERFTLICGVREKAGRWKITVTSPEGTATTQELPPDRTDEKIGIDVPSGEQGKVWTVQVEKVESGGSQCLGIGLRGIPPFFGSSTSTLLVSEES